MKGDEPVTADPVTPTLLRQWPLPEPGGSKHDRGHCLVVGGSVSTPGAVLLAGVAALRVGAGVLALAVPEPVSVPLAVAVPEAAVTGWTTHSDGALTTRGRDLLADRVGRADAVLVGPGVDDPAVARALVTAVVELAGPAIPVVLDAFALGVLPDIADSVAALSGRLVLTPNGGEARLLTTGADGTADDTELPDGQLARRVADRWGAAVSVDDAVASPGEPVRCVAAGHAGLGTSGSGDVLAGAVLGLLARGVDPYRAAAWATYLHAASGDRLAARVGRLGFLAREPLDELPQTLAQLQT